MKIIKFSSNLDTGLYIILLAYDFWRNQEAFPVNDFKYNKINSIIV